MFRKPVKDNAPHDITRHLTRRISNARISNARLARFTSARDRRGEPIGLGAVPRCDSKGFLGVRDARGAECAAR